MAQDMLEIGALAKHTAKGLSIMLMEMYLRVALKTIKLTEKVSIHIKVVKFMKVIGSTIYSMEQVLRSLKMALDSLVSSEMDKSTEWELMHGQTEHTMKANGAITK